MSNNLPQFAMPPAPPDAFFEDRVWVERLVNYGMPWEVAEWIAESVARKAYMMPPDIQERFLRAACEPNKLLGRLDDD